MDKIHNKNKNLSYTKYNEALLSIYFKKNFNTKNTYKPYKIKTRSLHRMHVLMQVRYYESIPHIS